MAWLSVPFLSRMSFLTFENDSTILVELDGDGPARQDAYSISTPSQVHRSQRLLVLSQLDNAASPIHNAPSRIFEHT
jgi:hypothetical protein